MARQVSELKKDELENIGDMLGYTPKAARHKAVRFLSGTQNTLKNWEYDETINFGDMHKVVRVFKYLDSINVIY